MTERNETADRVIDSVIALLEEERKTELELTAGTDRFEIKVDIRAYWIKEDNQ